MNFLSDKSNIVTALSASSLAISALVSLIPGVGSSLAAQFTKIAEYCFGITTIIYAEKYCLILLPLLALQFIIPIATILQILYCIINSKKGLGQSFDKLSLSLLVVGLVLTIVMPFSIYISSKVQDITDAQVADRIEQLNDFKDDLYKYEDDDNIGEKIITFFKDTGSSIYETANTQIKNSTDYLVNTLVTCFVIPVLTILLLLYLVRLLVSLLFGRKFNYNLGDRMIKSINNVEDKIVSSSKNLFKKDERYNELKKSYREGLESIENAMKSEDSLDEIKDLNIFDKD